MKHDITNIPLQKLTKAVKKAQQNGALINARIASTTKTATLNWGYY